jgi:hypothetical protein
MFKKNLSALLTLFSAIFLFGFTVSAQETEAAASSRLTSVSLPANAQRVLPGSIPSQVTQTLEKIVSVGSGKVSQGETEVLIWVSPNFKKANTETVINRLTDTLKVAGWKYEVGGSENGVTVFGALKDGASRRALVGFYGATDDALIFAWTELLSANSPVKQVESNPQVEQTESVSTQKSGSLSEIVGTWRNGNVSMLGEKNLRNGQVTARNGSTFSYKFFADGRFESIGYISSTMYGCTTDLFNDKRGRVEIAGSKLTLIPSKNYWKNTYSCSPASNKERDYVLDRETYDWRTKTDEYGKTLICLTNAKGESCYRRED